MLALKGKYMKIRFWCWFRKNIIGIDDNVRVPKKWYWVGCILFPIQTFQQRYRRNLRYDVLRNAIVFNGYAYPVYLFNYLKDEDAFIIIKEKGAAHQVNINIIAVENKD